MINLQSSREKIIIQISYLMLAFLMSSTIVNYLQNRDSFVILYIFSILATLVHLYQYKHAKNCTQAADRIMLILFGLFFTFFNIGEHQSFDILWVLILPSITIIIESYAKTKKWISLFLALLVGSIIWHYICPECIKYESFSLWSLLFAGIFLSGMTLYYKKIQESMEKKIANYQNTLEQKVYTVVKEMKSLNNELDTTQLEILQRLGTLGEYPFLDTSMHVRRLGLYSKKLALLSGLNEEEAEILQRAAPLHDIGKIGIEDNILNKSSLLNEDEYARLQNHTLIGESILGNSNKPLLQRASEIAGGHHEKYDGTGYPRSLKGETIPLSARIVAIADVFDALISKRSYKDGWSLVEVKEHFSQQAGIHFDPSLTKVFLNNLPEFVEIFHNNQNEIKPFTAEKDV